MTNIGDEMWSGRRASEVFSDRREPMELFNEALNSLPLEHPRVLNWYGPGGQGKSRLCEEFVRKMDMRNAEGERITYAVLDLENFSEHRDPIEAMLFLRLALSSRSKYKFPLFDAAFAKLFVQRFPGRRFDAVYSDQMSMLAPDLEDLILVLGPLAGPLGAGAALGVTLLLRRSKKLKKELRLLLEDDRAKSLLTRIDSSLLPNLIEDLPKYLGFDLSRIMQLKDAPSQVVLIDGYDGLWGNRMSSRAMKGVRRDKWIRNCIEAIPCALVAIFSREKLQWGGQWEAVFDDHLLNALSDHDADWFLRKVGVEPVAVRERIVESAQGLPFLLDIAVGQYRRLVAANTGEPSPENFADKPEEVVQRFLDHLSLDERQVLEIASYPEHIDDNLFLDLVERFLSGNAVSLWTQCAGRSFMTQRRDGHVVMHAMMRASLQAIHKNESPTLYKRVHQWLFDRYSACVAEAQTAAEITEKHDEMLILAARHAACISVEKVVEWAQLPHKLFDDAGRWTALSAVYSEAKEAVEESGTSSPDALGWIDFHLAHLFLFTGRLDEAGELYDQLSQAEEKSGRGASRVYALTLRSLGDVRRLTGYLDEAKLLYEKALQVHMDAGEEKDQHYATIRLHLSLVRQQLSDDSGAVTSLENIEQIFEIRFGRASIDFAEILFRVAVIHLKGKRFDQAENRLRRAIAIFETECGPKSHDVATVQLDLADCLLVTGDISGAKIVIGKAVASMEAALGPEHPDLGKALHLQAMILSVEGRRCGIVIPQLERAKDILLTTLGEDHEWFRSTEADLRRLQAQT